MTAERKYKGDVGAAMVIADLTEKGYSVYIPAVNQSSPIDMLAIKDNEILRIQAKYSSIGLVSQGNAWNDKHGSHKRQYQGDEFDYYAIYLSEINKVVYPSIKFGGIKIQCKVPNSATPFWWWEDFVDFTDEAPLKKNYKDFGYELTHKVTDKVVEGRIKRRKVERPSKEQLAKMLWEKSTRQIAKEYGVSDHAVAKWAKTYGLSKPTTGYWNKKYAGKI